MKISYFKEENEKTEVKTKTTLENENKKESITTEQPNIPVVSYDEHDG